MTGNDFESNAALPGIIAHEALEFRGARCGEVATLALAKGISRSTSLMSLAVSTRR
jgi:hypothetical protein